MNQHFTRSQRPVDPEIWAADPDENNLAEHWVGMPEYAQEDLRPMKSLKVHFHTMDDYKAFQAVIGQKLTKFTRAIWYPEAKIGHCNGSLRYTDES